MKKYNLPLDLCWLLFMCAAVVFLIYPSTQKVFVQATTGYPVIMGFVKFAVLASLGELLAMRIVNGHWRFNATDFWQKALVWGFLGVLITVMIMVFSAGAEALIKAGVLPNAKHGALAKIIPAFYKSALMNIFFGFEFMLFHRITDTLIAQNKLFSKWPTAKIAREINWENMFGFVWGSLFWFWIPAHTVTFSLPPEFRTASAALLSVVLGIILSFARQKAAKKTV